MTRVAMLLTGLALVPAACAPRAEPVQKPPLSILESSTPAADSVVASPVDELVLNFNPPARLDEVTVTGPAGTMPMMVHAVGETTHYSLPLSEAGPGAYRVDWKAHSQGLEHRGLVRFTIRD
jgi:methionine-rich copper-binding protein CopC